MRVTQTFRPSQPRVDVSRYGLRNREGLDALMFEQFNVPSVDHDRDHGGAPAPLRRNRAPADSIHDDGDLPPRARRGGRARRWSRSRHHAAQNRSGFGAEGVKALQAFGQKGGTLVTLASGRIYRANASPPLRTSWRACSKLSGRPIDAPVRFDTPPMPTHAAEGLALFMAGGQVYEVRPPQQQDVDLATYVEPTPQADGSLVSSAREEGVAVREARAGRWFGLPPAAPRSDARHVSAVIQRVAERPPARRRGETLHLVFPVRRQHRTRRTPYVRLSV